MVLHEVVLHEGVVVLVVVVVGLLVEDHVVVLVGDHVAEVEVVELQLIFLAI